MGEIVNAAVNLAVTRIDEELANAKRMYEKNHRGMAIAAALKTARYAGDQLAIERDSKGRKEINERGFMPSLSTLRDFIIRLPDNGPIGGATASYGPRTGAKEEREEERGDYSWIEKDRGMLYKPGSFGDITLENLYLPQTLKDTIRLLFIDKYKKPDKNKLPDVDEVSRLLLWGPPGTGKTTIAKAIGNEAGTPVLSVKLSGIIRKWVGDTEQNIRDIFQYARDHKPILLHFDDVESLVLAENLEPHELRWRNEVLSQLEGIEGRDPDINVLGSTNEPWSMNDAVLRRFPQRKPVMRPDYNGLLFVFQRELERKPGGKARWDNIKPYGFAPEEYVRRMEQDLRGPWMPSDVRDYVSTVWIVGNIDISKTNGTPKLKKEHFDAALELYEPNLTHERYKKWENYVKKKEWK